MAVPGREGASEEVTAPCFLQRIVGSYGQELANALADLLPPRQMVQITAGVLCLFCDPLAGSRGVLVLEPAVVVRDGHPVKNVGDRFNRSKHCNCASPAESMRLPPVQRTVALVRRES